MNAKLEFSNFVQIFIKLLLQYKNDSDGKIANLCKFLSRLGKSTHMLNYLDNSSKIQDDKNITQRQ